MCSSLAKTIPNRLTSNRKTANMQSRIRMFLSKRVKVMWPVASVVEEVLSPSNVILTSLTVKLLESWRLTLRFSDVVALLIVMYVSSTKVALGVKWLVGGA